MAVSFKLSGPVAANVRVAKDDTLRTRWALQRLGFLAPRSEGESLVANGEMLDGIKLFQKKSKLIADGVLKPGGPTERMIRASLFEKDNGPPDERAPAFQIGAVVGTGATNRPADVHATKRALSLAGIIGKDEVKSRMADRTFNGAIEMFQRVFNFKRDGKITRGGETEQTLARVVRPDLSDPDATKTRVGQVTANGETPERVLEDLGGDRRDLFPPDPLEFDKDEKDKAEKRQEPDIVFKDRPEHTKRPFFDSGSRTYRTNGPIKVERWSDALGADGIRFNVHWHPLDKDGKREPAFKDPKKIPESFVGHVGATGLLKGIAGVEPPSDIIHPPFDHPNGWEVDVEVSPQAIVHGNARGARLRVFVPQSIKNKN